MKKKTKLKMVIGISLYSQNGINFGRFPNVLNQFFLIQKFGYFQHKLATNWLSSLPFFSQMVIGDLQLNANDMIGFDSPRAASVSLSVPSSRPLKATPQPGNSDPPCY